MPAQDWTLTNNLVLLVDVLGQRGKLKGVRFPSNAEEAAELAKLIRDTVGFVEQLRREFRRWFDGVGKPTAVLDEIPVEQREAFLAARRTDVRLLGFSDTTVAWVSMQGDPTQNVPVNGVYAALTAACVIYLWSLANGQALRGGVDVGFGVELSANEVYGPVLESSYRLESEVASYPRIAVGAGLQRYLAAVGGQPAGSFESRVAIGMANLCNQFIVIDDDGVPILDCLGPAFRKDVCRGPDGTDLVRKAFEFVQKQLADPAIQANPDLLGKYEWLLTHFSSRLAIWGLGPDGTPAGS